MPREGKLSYSMKLSVVVTGGDPKNLLLMLELVTKMVSFMEFETF